MYTMHNAHKILFYFVKLLQDASVQLSFINNATVSRAHKGCFKMNIIVFHLTSSRSVHKFSLFRPIHKLQPTCILHDTVKICDNR
jgi:hypothetical protein